MSTTRIRSGPQDPTTAMLVVADLSKSFGGVQALDRVSLTIGRGEVHGLLGQNGSGKSTLIKILGGYYEPDAGGSVSIAGRNVQLPIRADQIGDLGIAIVHQNLALVRSLTVLENMLIGRIARSPFTTIRWRSEHRRVVELFSRFDTDIDPDAMVVELRPVQQAQIAIIRAFDAFEQMPSDHPRILILDEPTPFLPPTEVEELFRLVQQIAKTGASVIFVSHDIDEVLEITDALTVFRDGKVVGSARTQDMSKQEIIRMIVGRDVAIHRYEGSRIVPDGPAIGINGLRAWDLHPFDLTLTPGEIVGLTGLVGAGHEKLLHYLYGAARCEAGMLYLKGRKIDLSRMTPDRAIAAGMAYIPGDRQRQGLVETLPITENIGLPLLDSINRGWWVTPSHLEEHAKAVVERYDVRPRAVRLNAGALSGGNQQKVVIGKWFQTKPRLILLEEPTQGVDVGARDQIFQILRAMGNEGCSIICASSDHEQLAAICDRVLIFRQGKHIDTLGDNEVSKAEIARRTMAASA